MSDATNSKDWKLNDSDWNLLLRRIKDGKCTPFLGAGACYPVLPLGSDIAKGWAESNQYPLKDSEDLVRVAQFLAVMIDPMFPKEEIIKLLNNNNKLPDFNAPDEIHGVLADLNLPIYITTNYDDFMVQALKSRNVEVCREFCRWNSYVKKYHKPSIFSQKPAGFEPTPENPVVFHLHGLDKVPESIVITRDDYLDFLVNINRDSNQDDPMIPPRIQQAFAGTSLLFLGYGIEDWNFRVIFRHIASYLEKSIARTHVSVQIAPLEEGEQNEKAIEYLNKYFGELDIRVYWGTCSEFTRELKAKWEEFNREK